MNSQLLSMMGGGSSQNHTTAYADSDSNASLTRRADSCILKLKGLPYDTTKEHIYEFFADYKVNEISFVYEPDGRPSGLAFAEFESQEEALRAMSKNGEYIGRRYVKLLMVPREEMEDQVRLGTLAIPGAAARAARMAQVRNRRAQPAAAPRVAYPGYPTPLSTYGGWPAAERLAGHEGMAGAPMMPVVLSSNPQLMSSHLHGSEMPEPLHLLHPSPAMRPGFSWLTEHSVAPPAHQYPQVIESVSPQLTESNLQPVQNSTTLRIRGLPFKISPEEVFQFFHGYYPLQDSLRFNQDQLGRFNGEAWISFQTPEQALHAFRELNRHYIRNRYLELSLC